MKRVCLFLVMSVLAAFFVLSCAAPPESPEPAPVEPAPEAPPPAPVPEPVPEPVPAPEPEPVIETEDPSVTITRQQYDQTFSEVEAIIEELNATIKAKNMRKWESFLTSEFRGSVMSPQKLAELNDMPLLKRNKITIRTLKDYFDNVVVPSRANVRLDDLKFTDQDRVQAFMKINNDENVLIYQLEKINNKWKISVW